MHRAVQCMLMNVADAIVFVFGPASLGYLYEIRMRHACVSIDKTSFCCGNVRCVLLCYLLRYNFIALLRETELCIVSSTTQ